MIRCSCCADECFVAGGAAEREFLSDNGLVVRVLRVDVQHQCGGDSVGFVGGV